MLSSLALRAYAEKSVAVGFAAYLTKPARQHNLYTAVSTVLAGGQATIESAPVAEPIAAPVCTEIVDVAARPRLLVAEDNLVNQKVAVLTLSKMGYETVRRLGWPSGRRGVPQRIVRVHPDGLSDA